MQKFTATWDCTVKNIVIGTRKSPLALWQTNFIRMALLSLHPGLSVEVRHIVTTGDRTQASSAPIPAIGGKGLFTAELEDALRAGEIDLAVHCLKDLPTVMDSAFCLGAIPERANPFDALISRNGERLSSLREGAVVGTSSLRRSSQIVRLRPDLRCEHIRGNVDSRLKKLRDPDGPFDAIVLAAAGLDRLGWTSEITQTFGPDEMLPAPGQGALAIECRAGDATVLDLLKPLHCENTASAVTAERSFLNALGAGCNTPVAAFALVENVAGDTILSFAGRCLAPDGSDAIEVSTSGVPEQAEALGRRMADQVIQRGFKVCG